MRAQMIQVPCPKCEWRAFDVSDIPREEFIIAIKCTHCGNVVELVLSNYLTPSVIPTQREGTD
jgi:endogenous inhibitor of DNA gyrase (YacG/DUF329 family)